MKQSIVNMWNKQKKWVKLTIVTSFREIFNLFSYIGGFNLYVVKFLFEMLYVSI